MAISSEHWGEFESPERESDVTPHEMRRRLIQLGLSFSVNHPEPQADESTNAYAVSLPAELGAMDETMLHSLSLCPYIAKMEALIDKVKEMDAIDSSVVEPIPERGQTIQGLPMLPLSKENTRYLLRKSCATIAAHAGFSVMSSMVQDVLADVLNEYLRQLTLKLRTAVDQCGRSGASNFTYPLFRAFTEMNIDPLEVRDYFYHSVLKHNKTLVKSAQVLHRDYSRLQEEVRPSSEVEEENIPELHVQEDQLQSSLEPGLQMLDSLEHDESLQNMDAEEEIVVNDSPSNQEYVHSTSSDFSSPDGQGLAAKKRKMT